MLGYLLEEYIRNTLPHYAKATRGTLRTIIPRLPVNEGWLATRSPDIYRGGVWRCRVLSPGPKVYIANVYKRSPFNFSYS